MNDDLYWTENRRPLLDHVDVVCNKEIRRMSNVTKLLCNFMEMSIHKNAQVLAVEQVSAQRMTATLKLESGEVVNITLEWHYNF